MPASVEKRGPWSISIEAELERVGQARKSPTSHTHDGPSMYRVPSYIKRQNPRAYDHQVLSFGLYKRDFDSMTRMDDVRLEVVSCFLEQMRMMPSSSVDSWEALCERVAGPPEKAEALQNLYDDDPGEGLVTPATVRSILTFDAVFIMLFSLFHSRDLHGMHPSLNYGRFELIFHQKGVNRNISALYYDLWLFENQIPLWMIREVWNLMYEDRSDHLFNSHIRHTILTAMETHLLPLDRSMFGRENKDGISFLECDHLLHCMYITVCDQQSLASLTQSPQQRRLTPSPGDRSLAWGKACMSCETFLQQRSRLSRTLLHWVHRWVRRRPSLHGETQALNFESLVLRSLLPISELHKAGIVVRGTQTNLTDIKFVTSSFFKATLYLPQINIDDHTERILRNLGAYEMIHSYTEHKLISYLSIMDDLINTEEDVRLLRKGKEPVIGVNFLGDDKDIATLFNALGRNVYFTKSEQCNSLTKKVNDWCTQDYRQKLNKFVDRFHDRPWILVSLLAATVLVIMTAIQTGYTLKSFYKA